MTLLTHRAHKLLADPTALRCGRVRAAWGHLSRLEEVFREVSFLLGGELGGELLVLLVLLVLCSPQSQSTEVS